MAGFKLGVVNIGRAAGKVKYALLDDRDIYLVENYAFEARTEINQDGNGAHIYAYVYNIHQGRASAQYLHELIWERHCGGIAPGWKVIHKNNITVDNRFENLCLVRDNDLSVSCVDEEPSHKFSKDQSLYWIAVQQIHIDPLHQHFQQPLCSRLLDGDGDLITEEVSVLESGCVLFYECHYPPCTNMEKHIREFSICGRCQTVRYCGVLCQQKDWPIHKQYCRERCRPQFMEVPDR